MSWQTSPAATEVEDVVMDWLRQMVGLSEAWTGVVHDTASTATLCALLCAREKASGFSQNAGGLQALEAPPAREIREITRVAEAGEGWGVPASWD